VQVVWQGLPVRDLALGMLPKELCGAGQGLRATNPEPAAPTIYSGTPSSKSHLPRRLSGLRLALAAFAKGIVDAGAWFWDLPLRVHWLLEVAVVGAI